MQNIRSSKSNQINHQRVALFPPPQKKNKNKTKQTALGSEEDDRCQNKWDGMLVHADVHYVQLLESSTVVNESNSSGANSNPPDQYGGVALPFVCGKMKNRPR